jgi:hypothetical protein
MESARLRLIDNALLEDVWIDGIGKIEQISSGTYRILLYRDRRAMDGSDVDHEIRLSVLVSMNALEAIFVAMKTAAECGNGVAHISSMLH